MLRTCYASLTVLIFVIIAVALAALPTEAHAGRFAGQRQAALVNEESLVLADTIGYEGESGCCEKRCVSYRYHHRWKKVCCDCGPPQNIVLAVKDPCTGCAVEVPVCLPSCCKGDPKVCSRPGLFGRSVVTYSWCCGYDVKIVF